MSRLRRLMMMQGGTGESPEFIEFRADKYVPTGIEKNSELKVYLKIRFESLSSYQTVIGSYGGGWFNMGPYKGDMEDFYGNNSKIVIPYEEWKVGNIIEIVKDRNKTYVDGVLKAEHAYQSFSRTDILGIGGNTFGIYADVYAFSIWDNDVLVDEYYPAIVDGKEYFKGKNTGKLLEVVTKTT